MDFLEKINRTSFLGSEFLTYLWFLTETTDASFTYGKEDEPFEIYFDDRLTVGGAQINAQENLFRGGHPTTSLEAHAALRLGKLAHEARLRFVKGAQEWAFILKAQSLSISALNVPAVLSKNDEDRFYERMYLAEQLEEMLESLFRRFLSLRLSEAWKNEWLPSIRQWVGEAVEKPQTSNGVADEVEPDLDDEGDWQGERPPWELGGTDD